MAWKRRGLVASLVAVLLAACGSGSPSVAARNSSSPIDHMPGWRISWLAYSPDGSNLAVLGSLAARSDLLGIASVTGWREGLSGKAVYSMAWSPDGDTLLVATGNVGDSSHMKLAQLGASGQDLGRDVPTSLVITGGMTYLTASKVVVAARGAGSPWTHLWEIDLHDGSAVPLTSDDRAIDEQPVALDSASIAFVSGPAASEGSGSKGRVYRMDVESRNVVALTGADLTVLDLGVTQDRRSIVFSARGGPDQSTQMLAIGGIDSPSRARSIPRAARTPVGIPGQARIAFADPNADFRLRTVALAEFPP